MPASGVKIRNPKIDTQWTKDHWDRKPARAGNAVTGHSRRAQYRHSAAPKAGLRITNFASFLFLFCGPYF
jgi:hypothetical protein